MVLVANRIYQGLNNQLNHAEDLRSFYTKSYITANGQVFMNLAAIQYCTLSEIDSFIEISGYELYGSSDANSSLLSKVSSDYIKMAYTGHFPISFHIVNQNGEKQLLLGTPRGKQDVLSGMLCGNIPSVNMHRRASLREAVPNLSRLLKYSGVIVGAGDYLDTSIDMVLEAANGADYIFSIIAYPCKPDELNAEIDRANSFLDTYQGLTQKQIAYGSGTRRDVLHDDHGVGDLMTLLADVKSRFAQGLNVGMWKVYLSLCAPDASSYSKAYAAMASSLYQSVANPSPVGALSLVTTPYAPFVMSSWSLPSAFVGDVDYGGLYSNSFGNLLLPESLSKLFALPERAHRGIAIKQQGSSRENEFGAFSRFAPQVTSKALISLGAVAETGEQIAIPQEGLRQHTFVSGTTQSGKTTTTLRILSEAARAGIPFVVLESAKKQYCELLGKEQFAHSLAVYSGGYDAKLLLINPFQPEVGTSLDSHIQSLVALLVSLFNEQAPLPQVINLLVYKAYDKMGWSPKERIKHSEHREYPTLSTLIDLIDEVVDEIGYSTKYSETADNMKGVIRVRLTSLIQGAMGDVLNSGKNTSIRQMLKTSAIIELDDFPDTSKTFVAGLLALKMYEYSRNQDYGTDTRRLLVIEEAHNLVPNVEAGQGHANVALCSSHFTSMLAEVAAYGTGLVIVDQRPTAVAPAVIANTGTKVIHNLLAGEDKRTVAVSMGLTDTEENMLSDLRVGQAIVKIPNASEKCRVNIQPVLDKGVSINWADLFLDADGRLGRAHEASSEELALFIADISAEALERCIAFAEMRYGNSFSFEEKMKYSGLLLNSADISVREKRQLLYELLENIGGEQ